MFNILLQIMDDGRLTDSQGRHVDFKNTIIVMTSNVGAKNITDRGTQLGFDHSAGENAEKSEDERIHDLVMGDLKRTFKPEFLNRVDDIIVFHRLTQENINAIAGNMLAAVAKRMENMEVKLTWTDAAVNALGEAGFDPAYGARPLRRTIQTKVEDAVAELLLTGEIHAGDTVLVDAAEGKVTVTKAPETAEPVSDDKTSV